MWTEIPLRSIRRWRRKYYEYKVRTQVRSMGEGLWVGGPTELSENTTLGNNTHFSGMKISGSGYVEIGNNFHSGPGSEIRTITHNYDNGEAIPYDKTWITDDVIIGNNVWLGQDVTVLPGVEIEEGAIIQVGSVVVNDIPKCAVAGGHPAEVFKYRDKDHYEQLKKRGDFH